MSFNWFWETSFIYNCVTFVVVVKYRQLKKRFEFCYICPMLLTSFMILAVPLSFLLSLSIPLMGYGFICSMFCTMQMIMIVIWQFLRHSMSHFSPSISESKSTENVEDLQSSFPIWDCRVFFMILFQGNLNKFNYVMLVAKSVKPTDLSSHDDSNAASSASKKKRKKKLKRKDESENKLEFINQEDELFYKVWTYFFIKWSGLKNELMCTLQQALECCYHKCIYISYLLFLRRFVKQCWSITRRTHYSILPCFSENKEDFGLYP